MCIRPRFLSELGVGMVAFSALCAASLFALVLDRVDGSLCGTDIRSVGALVNVWAPAFSLLSFLGLGLGSRHQVCPRLCRIGVAITLLVSAAALLVVSLVTGSCR